MGESEKVPHSGPESYRFAEHRRYLDGLFDALGVQKPVTMVVHDWGSALGFDRANRHRDAVAGIAYMEAVVLPRTWADFPDPRFQMALRSDAGEQLILEQNSFAERIFHAGCFANSLRKRSTRIDDPFRRQVRADVLR